MGRYTIEINDAFVEDCGMKKLLLPIKLNECGSYWLPTGITLTPYTEPDKDETHQNGLNEAYMNGLNDMHEALKKVSGMSAKHAMDIFGEDFPSISVLLNNLSGNEIMEKIGAYEEKKEIHFGDEIRNKQKPDIRVCVTDVRGGRWDGFALSDVENCCRFGSGYNDRYLDGWEKTGRNFAAILQQMGDENVEQK